MFDLPGFVAKIKEEYKLYVNSYNDVGSFTPAQIGILLARSYTLKRFKDTQDDYSLTKGQLWKIIYHYSKEEQVLENIAPERLKRLSQRTGLPAYFIKDVFIRKGPKFTINEFYELAKRKNRIVEEHDIPQRIVTVG